MPDYAFVKDRNENVCGIWLHNPEEWFSDANENGALKYLKLQTLIVKHDLSHEIFNLILDGNFRLVPNTVDNNGGKFLMFGSLPAPGEEMVPDKVSKKEAPRPPPSNVPKDHKRDSFIWSYRGELIIALLVGSLLIAVIIFFNFTSFQTGTSLSSLSSPQPLVTEDYIANFLWDGTLTEIINYRVASSDKFTMLYRDFNVPLVTKPISNPYIEFIRIDPPDRTIPYLKDDQGTASLLNGFVNTGALSDIQKKAERNEIGIYKEGGFLPGTYPVKYQYRFHPPIEYDQTTAHLNIMLAGDNHLAYNRVKIQVPESSVKEIYFNPPHLKVAKEGAVIIATGEVEEREVLSFEVILDKEILSTLPGFPKYTNNIAEKVKAAYPNQAAFKP
jgi:hypothetical protein